MFLNVVQSQVELRQMGERGEGRGGDLLQVVVVQVEHPEVGQPAEGGLLHRLDPVLAEVELLHAGEAAEDPGGELLQEVLPQGEDRHSFQAVKGGVRHSEYFVVGQPQLYQLLLLDEPSVRQAEMVSL